MHRKHEISSYSYPPFLTDKVSKKYLDYKFSGNQNQLKDKSDVHYFKIYISLILLSLNCGAFSICG